jgi:hypothetical protein
LSEAQVQEVWILVQAIGLQEVTTVEDWDQLILGEEVAVVLLIFDLI